MNIFPDMLSYWEKESFIRYDHIVVGAGITGLSVACELLERNPNQSVLVLESGILPNGASTKNAGFACTGSLSEHVHDRNLMGEQSWLRLVADRKKGLELLRKRLGDADLHYEQLGGFELVMKNQDDSFLQEMQAVNESLKFLFGKPPFEFADKRISEFGFPAGVNHLVANSTEGQIHTGAAMRQLWRYAQPLGAHVLTGAAVNQVIQETGFVNVMCNDISFRATQVFLCTNAFTKNFLPKEDIQPGRGQVLITTPIPNLKIKGIFFYQEGFYYFRNQEGRVLLGGGRNLDITGETTYEPGPNPMILEKLEQLLKEVIIPGQEFEVEQTWSGIMAFGGNKTPLIKRVDENLFVAARLNGMGVALGSKLARDLVDLAMQK